MEMISGLPFFSEQRSERLFFGGWYEFFLEHLGRGYDLGLSESSFKIVLNNSEKKAR